MKNKFFKKALSVFTAMAMMLSLMTGIPFSELGLDITVSAASAAYDGVPVAPQQITSSSYRSFGFTETNWEQYNGYYAIRNAKELYGFAEINDYNSPNYIKAVLLNDIVVNETVSESGATYSWTPIGHHSYFSGEFDGNGHYISGLYFNDPSEYQVGLFGWTSKANIRNVTLKNSYLCADRMVGGIVGRMAGTTLTNCKVDSDVTIVATCADGNAVTVGGMFGGTGVVSVNDLTLCDFTNCTSLATVKAPNVQKEDNVYQSPKMGAFGGAANTNACESTAGTNCFYVPNSVTGADGTWDRGIGGIEYIIHSNLTEISIDNNGEITGTHTHVSATHSRIEPTCYSTGLTEYSYCIICGEITSGTREEIPIVDHEYSEATCKVPKTCVYCGVTTGGTIDHIYSNATCTAPPTCIMCGLENGSVNPDNHTTDETQWGIVSSNRRYHALVYKCCGAIQSNEELHKDSMENGVCSKCSYVCEHLSVTNGKCDDCGIEGDTSYVNRYWDAVNKKVITNDYALASNVTEITSSTSTLSEGWYIVKGEVTNSNRLTVSGTVNLILADGCTLNVANGIYVPGGTTLNIYGQIQGTGKLVASNKSDADNAAIGGNKKENAGSIVINGGVVEATGGTGSKGAGAAIGGGYNVRATDVEINGGVVKASGTYRYSATIGMGDYGTNGAHSVTIHGGTITASATQYAIGSGDTTTNYCTVTVDGGNISGNVCGKTLTNTSGTSVSCVEITLNGATDGTIVTELEGITYGLTDVKTIGDKLYLYLPADTMPTSVTAGGNTYVCNVDGTFYQEHNWVNATCFSPKHCSRCEITEGDASSHNYENGVCTYCGKDENGVFHIKTAEQLVAFAQYVELGNKDADAVLDADIVMTDVAWTPICQTVSFHDTAATDTGYSGTFDGNGHTISNLTVTFNPDTSKTYSHGLFGTVSGTVKNLGMVNFNYENTTGDTRAGSIAGQVLTNGTITNCYSVGHTVKTNNNIAGGIAGCNYGGIISNCYALKLNGSVSGYDTRWGGVVGDCQKDSTAPDLAQTYGTVSNCYTDDTRVVSSQSENANIENCALEEDTAFASGKVAYLLNGGKTDGTQSWYQNLSDDNNKDSYPVLNDTHGTVYSVLNCKETATVYRNVNENEPHTDNNSDGECDVCGGNAHIHEWTYTASNNTITAECGAADCPATGTNTIVISASGKTYDGTAVTATVTNNADTTDYSSSIVYRDNDGDVVTEAVNAGTYTANLTLTSANSTEVTASVEFTIDEKAITVTADNKSKTYGEDDPTFTYTATGLEVNDTLTGTLSRETGENVGTYAITQGTLANPNYEITFVEGTFTINGVDISAATAVQNGTLTYDGTAQTPTFTVTLGNTTLTADDYDVIVTAQTNAGSYTATIEGKGNCEGTIADVAWKILPANIDDTSITYAPLTYNGAEQTPVFTIKLGDYTLNASDYSVTVTAQINAGDYTATIKGNVNFDGNIDVDWSIGKKAADEVTSPTAATITYGQTLSEATLTSGWSWVDGTVIPTVMNNGYAAEITVDDNNYDYTSIDGYNADTHKITRTIAVTVEKAAPTITTEPYAAAGLVYDGSAKVLVNEGAVTGGSFVYSLTGNNFTATLPTATEAKEYTVYWRVAGDENHNNSETFNFKVTIAKATPPALTIPTATSITYGDTLSSSVLSDSSWAWVDGTIVPNASADYNAYIEVDDSNYDYTDVDGYNETVHTVTRTIAVTVNRAELTVTAESYTVKLGNPLPETLEYEVTGLIGNDTIDSIGANVAIGYESGVTPSAVGDYTIVVSGEAETDNYTITYENGKLIITEKNVQTITASDVTLTYGDTAKINATTNGDGTISYTVATGTDVITVAADGTVTPLKAGTATVTITAADTADYAVATKTVTVTVNKKKIAIPAADTKEYTYTGTAQTYGVASTDDYTVTGGVQTNAGNYPITIALKDENYEWDGTLGTYTFVIKQANVTITAKSYTIKVGEALPTFEYDVTGLVNGETLPIDVTISCSATNSETEGNYPITVTGVADSTNYKFTYVNGTLTVSAKEEQTITASNVTTTYGDTAKINATTNGNGAISYAVATGTDVITVAADGTVTPLKAGTATVTITAAETDTYAQATKTVTITVNKATVTITAKDYTIYIGEDVPAFEYTATGLVNGETLPITPVITCDVTDTSKTGTYDIIVTGDAESDNYRFAYVNGTLTVKRKSTGGGGGGGGYTPSRPSTPTNPEIGGKAKTWTDIATELNGMANGSETTIELNGNYDVPVDVIKAIAEKDLKVTFIVDTNRSWYVDGADITNPVAADLSVTTTIRVDSSSLRGIEGYEFSIDGTSLPTEFAYSFAKRNAGKFANLYIKTDDGFVFVDNVKLDENGLAKELDLSVKGQYVIMVCEFSDRMGDSNNDGVLNAMDASAILRDIVELEKAANPEMADYNGDGRTNALDASEILKVIVGLIPDKYEFKAENN